MPRQSKPLTALEVKRLTHPGFHAVGEVPGLHLQVTKTGARSWVLRYATGETRLARSGKPYKVRRDMGLGSYPGVSLAQARDKARLVHEKLDAGIDPITERKAADQSRRAAELARMTFADAAAEVVKIKQAEARNVKHGKQWAATLETYAYPKLGEMAVSDIEMVHVKQALEPIWQTKTETATRVRQRIEAVLNWATVHGHRQGDNPARWKGNLDTVLPAPSKVAKVEHHRAMPIDAMPSFWQALEKRTGDAAKCLAFTILTGCRSGESRGATWAEIDLDNAIWIIPAERMKAGKEHRVPLSAPALTLLKAQPQDRERVFQSPQGKALSDAAMTALLRRMGEDHRATVHGFRSTFRDWMAERTGTPHEVAEAALAHTIKSSTEAAYRRGDLYAKRARVMDQWAAFITTPAPAGASNVAPIRGEVASDG
ncbi:tyrosine-type recombinase/integrase [Vreelandella salicampi]|uniref:Tyrosine-type recombinase/integrase n=1 Tax=Vreelandella salicampi TaxID=1449798 RepID=A0A7Z0LKV1_9GAMM|nr:site-specific integrase [Halomonas salicampi]NYS60815.1 tyrosine-type recombinase/integrase [Halomonas salicampi]